MEKNEVESEVRGGKEVERDVKEKVEESEMGKKQKKIIKGGK